MLESLIICTFLPAIFDAVLTSKLTLPPKSNLKCPWDSKDKQEENEGYYKMGRWNKLIRKGDNIMQRKKNRRGVEREVQWIKSKRIGKVERNLRERKIEIENKNENWRMRKKDI